MAEVEEFAKPELPKMLVQLLKFTSMTLDKTCQILVNSLFGKKVT
jgi:hypothetical protein